MNRHCFCFVFLLLLASSGGIAVLSGVAQQPQLSRFNSPAQAFQAVLATHRNSDYPYRDALQFPAAPPTNNRQLLHLTWFSGSSPNVAMQWVVSTSGQGYSVRSVYNWAEQNSGSWQLSPDKIVSLRDEVANFKVASSSPPMKKLVLVSFYRGSKWTTHFCAEDALPLTMRGLVNASHTHPFSLARRDTQKAQKQE